MRRLIIILFCLPIIALGQNIPSTKNTKNPKSENVKHNNDNKLSAIQPKNQIGYIFNTKACPFGLNYFMFPYKRFGFYVDYRNHFGVFAKRPSGYDSAFDDLNWLLYDMEAVPNGNTSSSNKGYSTFNYGTAIYLFGNQNYALIAYFGTGTATNKIVTYDEYIALYSGPYYVSNTNKEKYTNYNFGILRQRRSGLSYQIGFDTAVPGINFGIGMRLN
tara:strand:- start:3092 stop:3742 length:651 start_codon:yes stop_codon:yes gene_type:complete